jgi:hypothetical protein
VNSFRSGILCLGLLLSGALPGKAQTPPNPPAEAPPPPPTMRPVIQAPPAPPPKVPDVRQPGETGWWIGVNAWFPTEKPYIEKGHAATFTQVASVQFQGTPKLSDGIELGLALGLHNALRFTYFESRASGNIPAGLANDVQLWSQTYTAGTYLTTDYRMQRGVISFDYLTWPYPVESRHFRLKTLWQVQYTGFKSGFDAPQLPLVDSNGNPIVDANGNPISYAGNGSRWFIFPEFGLGVAYYSGRHLRVEGNASGFFFPHRDTIWDADASANLKYGKLEFRVGARAMHFKTSPQAEYFFHNTMGGAFVGVRWHSD